MDRELKPKIMEAARHLFNEFGYNQVSMRDIAKALNISVGNLTYYFKTKQELVESVAKEKYLHYHKFIPVSSLIELDESFCRALKYQAENQYFFRQYRQLAYLSEVVYKIQHEVVSDIYDMLLGTFSELCAQGQMLPEEFCGQYMRAADAIVSVLIYGLLHGRSQRHECLWGIIFPLLSADGKAECLRLSLPL